MRISYRGRRPVQRKDDLRMRIHSDTLTSGDLYRALDLSGVFSEGVWIEDFSRHGSHSRDHAFEVRLAAEPGADRNGKTRLARNTGQYGAAAEPFKAATYDEWGYWIAAVFSYDPNAKMSYYDDAEDFARKTGGDYPLPDRNA